MAAGEFYYKTSTGALYYRDSTDVERMLPYSSSGGNSPLSTIPPTTAVGTIVAGNFGRGGSTTRYAGLAYLSSSNWRYVYFSVSYSLRSTTKPLGSIRVSGTLFQMYWGNGWWQAVAN